MTANQRLPYQPTNRLLTLEQVAKELNVSVRTVQRRRKKGDLKLKQVKFGTSRPQFKLSDVNAAIEKATKSTEESDCIDADLDSVIPKQLTLSLE